LGTDWYEYGDGRGEYGVCVFAQGMDWGVM
jgi:hypothetical protein